MRNDNSIANSPGMVGPAVFKGYKLLVRSPICQHDEDLPTLTSPSSRSCTCVSLSSLASSVNRFLFLDKLM